MPVLEEHRKPAFIMLHTRLARSGLAFIATLSGTTQNVASGIRRPGEVGFVNALNRALSGSASADNTYDVAIVGGGMVGAAVAALLGKRARLEGTWGVPYRGTPLHTRPRHPCADGMQAPTG